MKLLKSPIRIAVTGPESTGKTTLAKQLAEKFHGQYIPEYAREYVETLTRHYNYQDIEFIARKQVQQYLDTLESAEKIFFFDTWLIVTKVWFSWVFGQIPVWLEERINDCPIDLFLICSPDLPWEADPVRENGGENRIRLFEQYKLELKHYNFNFVEISGTGTERLENAIGAIHDFKILL
jgi:NadR type nicotinamide-nucleotide adenylyltransferase